MLFIFFLAAKTDPNAAAWAAYYQQQQYYQQSGSGAPSAQQAGTPGQPEANSGKWVFASTRSSSVHRLFLYFKGSVPVNPQTGQPDYTAQWIQYYRSIGAMKDAEALEEQLKVNKVMAPLWFIYTYSSCS